MSKHSESHNNGGSTLSYHAKLTGGENGTTEKMLVDLLCDLMHYTADLNDVDFQRAIDNARINFCHERYSASEHTFCKPLS